MPTFDGLIKYGSFSGAKINTIEAKYEPGAVIRWSIEGNDITEAEIVIGSGDQELFEEYDPASGGAVTHPIAKPGSPARLTFREGLGKPGAERDVTYDILCAITPGEPRIEAYREGSAGWKKPKIKIRDVVGMMSLFAHLERATVEIGVHDPVVDDGGVESYVWVILSEGRWVEMEQVRGLVTHNKGNRLTLRLKAGRYQIGLRRREQHAVEVERTLVVWGGLEEEGGDKGV